uniref:MFS domain-containing protein n=1 Tax=Globodera pallida TaxID=36090 RepID=A0A183BQN9_GLOPA
MDTDDVILKYISPKWRSCIVIVAGMVLQFSYGLVYTFGNLLPYLASYLRWKVEPQLNDGSLIWLQSLLAGFPFAFLVGAYLQKVIGARWAAALGSFLYTGGLALSYLSIQKSYFSLFITLGIFCGFGQGAAYTCVLTQCQKWLPHRVGLVTGLITAGFGGGAFLISPIQTKFINPNNLNVDANGYFTQEDLLERVPKMFLLLAFIFGTLQFFALIFIAAPTNKPQEMLLKNKPKLSNAGIDPTILEHRLSTASCVSYTSTIHYNAPTHSKSAILCSDTFFLVFISLMLNCIWVQTISGFYKAYGQTFIDDDFLLATINSFASVFNTISPICWGVIADKFSYQLSMSIACTFGAVLMWTLGLVKLSGLAALYFVWICAMFCCVGATSLFPYAAHRCFGSDHFGFSYGCLQMAMFAAGVLNALGSQFLLSIIGLQIHFTIIGFTMFISLLLTIFMSRTQFGQLAI